MNKETYIQKLRDILIDFDTNRDFLRPDYFLDDIYLVSEGYFTAVFEEARKKARQVSLDWWEENCEGDCEEDISSKEI
jgi:hypothetical protein